MRSEDAMDGVYEFVLPVEAAVALAETSVSSCSGTTDVPVATYDLSFYTAPLVEPLQLEVMWLYSSTSDTNDILLSETVWFPAGQHRALYRSSINFSDDLSRNTPKSLQVPPKNPLPVEKYAEISTGTPQNTPTCIENGKKLDRSAMSTLVIPSAHSVIPGEAKNSLKIQVKPIDPPEDFRGLGIICKKNDGTR